MTSLLDASVLLPLLSDQHEHREITVRWFGTRADRAYATCPSTQGSLLRGLLRFGLNAAEAWEVLESFVRTPEHEFWPDQMSYGEVDWRGIAGHRQVTDAYLAALARDRGQHLVTLDKGLARLHPDVAVLLTDLV